MQYNYLNGIRVFGLTENLGYLLPRFTLEQNGNRPQWLYFTSVLKRRRCPYAKVSNSSLQLANEFLETMKNVNECLADGSLLRGSKASCAHVMDEDQYFAAPGLEWDGPAQDGLARILLATKCLRNQGSGAIFYNSQGAPHAQLLLLHIL